jgi:hypothetical protein
MADVLVVSGSHYRFVTSLPVSGAYTITVSSAGESSFLGPGSFGVSSGGGTALGAGVDNAITGTMTSYTAPQVIVQYHAIACPPASDEPTFTGTGNVTFLLAKGNVTDTEVTESLQSTIKADIAIALGIAEPDRVFIDQIKKSPRRDKEVNMVVHVEHDDTDRDAIADKTTQVAAAVKDALNAGGLNVCGCNAASLVNQQVQTSITC